MTVEIRNPAKLPTDLYPAEKEFVRCLAAGESCKVGGGKLPTEGIESGQGANVVRGEVIRFFAFGGNDDHSTLGPVIRLQGAWICGEKPLNLMYADIPYALQFVNCHFAIGVEMLRTECVALCLDESCLAHGLMASGLTTKENVHMCGLSSKGEVHLMNANIGGNLSCKGGNMHNPSGYALSADNLVTKGSVTLSENFSAKGGVRLSGANIGGNLVCKGGKFVKLQRYGLVANGITVEGSVFLNGCFSAEGEVSFLGADIGGDLNCQGGKFYNPRRKVKTGGNALIVNGVTTRGHVFLSNGFFAEGNVRMRGANIGGNLDCAGGMFNNPNRYALNAERVKTGGHVFLNKHVSGGNQPFSADGRVRFANADIGRNFNCKGGRFSHLGEGSAIAAAGLRTRGAVFFSERFVVQGHVNMKVARIGGNFVCKECGSDAKGNIDLSSAKAIAVDDDSNVWKKFKFILDGFTYDTFFGEEAPKGKSRLEWLTSRPTERGIKGKKVKIPFSPLPYEQAAKVLFNMGHDNVAREILLEKECRITKHEKWEWWQKPIRWSWGILAGYGYKPAWTFIWIMAVVVMGWGLFGCADKHGRMVPHQLIVLTNPEYKYELSRATRDGGQCRNGPNPTELVAQLFPNYPEFNAFVYSLDVFIPFFALHQESYWYPKPSAADREILLWILPFWYWLEIGAGWILTSLFLLSVTGLLRPRQSSAE